MERVDFEMTVCGTSPTFEVVGNEYETNVSRYEIMDFLIREAAKCHGWANELLEIWDYTMHRTWQTGGWEVIAFYDYGVDGTWDYRPDREYNAIYILEVDTTKGSAFARLYDVTSAGVCLV